MQTLKNLAFFLVAIGLIVSLTKNIFEYRHKQEFYTLYEKQLQNEQKHNKKLKSSIAQSSDYFTVEEVIREKLNKTKPGEYVIVMPNNNQITQSASQPTKPTYRQWIDLFFY